MKTTVRGFRIRVGSPSHAHWTNSICEVTYRLTEFSLRAHCDIKDPALLAPSNHNGLLKLRKPHRDVNMKALFTPSLRSVPLADVETIVLFLEPRASTNVWMNHQE